MHIRLVHFAPLALILPLAGCVAETAGDEIPAATEGAASGSSDIVRFHEVIPGKIYRGGELTSAQVDSLRRDYNIKTVLDLRVVEREKIKDHEKQDVQSHPGMEYINIRINPWLRVDESGINQALALLDDESKQPIYIHCLGGVDRTGVIVAIHRVEKEAWAPTCAHAEWTEYGYQGWGHRWVFGQYLRYFKERESAFEKQNGITYKLDESWPLAKCDNGVER